MMLRNLTQQLVAFAILCASQMAWANEMSFQAKADPALQSFFQMQPERPIQISIELAWTEDEVAQREQIRTIKDYNARSDQFFKYVNQTLRPKVATFQNTCGTVLAEAGSIVEKILRPGIVIVANVTYDVAVKLASSDVVQALRIDTIPETSQTSP